MIYYQLECLYFHFACLNILVLCLFVLDFVILAGKVTICSHFDAYSIFVKSLFPSCGVE